ncbi:Transcription initiation factor IIA large subunit [Ceratocystis platani]|uniref:Transcription initiation factor IIA large subunit n=2 Tax=Ceratocystis TaxID=5157 RepID=A0A0F8BW82_CERFI|nr:Transcription initiation factor IIA large subunit [Ceratocystis platani]
MSNTAVGAVYEQIIDDVISSARVDFEESGIDEATLEDLRKGWQEKLTGLSIAEFSWDPKPVAEAPPPEDESSFTPMLNADSGMMLPQGSYLQPGQMPLPGNDESYIKAEPEQQPELTNVSFQNVAAARAAQQLQSNYGARATNSINAIRTGLGGQENGQGQQQQQPGIALPHPSQTDGAVDPDDSDVEGVLMRRQANGTLEEMGRVEIDRLLHKHIAARAQTMEGGGLMVPLKSATRRNRKTSSSNESAERSAASGQVDGIDDDDDDEDAINSDLDDPEDPEENSDDEDDPLGPMMLCMYDKVQRVKNKWKCVLKDGVLTVNGKDYVFHKATGEYEW